MTATETRGVNNIDWIVAYINSLLKNCFDSEIENVASRSSSEIAGESEDSSRFRDAEARRNRLIGAELSFSMGC